MVRRPALACHRAGALGAVLCSIHSSSETSRGEPPSVPAPRPRRLQASASLRARRACGHGQDWGVFSDVSDWLRPPALRCLATQFGDQPISIQLLASPSDARPRTPRALAVMDPCCAPSLDHSVLCMHPSLAARCQILLDTTTQPGHAPPVLACEAAKTPRSGAIITAATSLQLRPSLVRGAPTRGEQEN